MLHFPSIMAERDRPRWVETKLPNHPEFRHIRFFECKGATILFRATTNEPARKRDRVMIEVKSGKGSAPDAVYFGTKFQREQLKEEIHELGLPKFAGVKKKVDSMLKKKRIKYIR